MFQCRLRTILSSVMSWNPHEVQHPFDCSTTHQWSTLLTVPKQAQSMNTLVDGSSGKTVVTTDVELHQPEKRLEMARSDLDHVTLRLGEFKQFVSKKTY